jgi:quinol monooxygenase YgiN
MTPEMPMTNAADAVDSASIAPAPAGRHVAWMFELVVREGREADFRALMGEMAAATERNEPGTLDYEWYVGDDGRRLHLFERYADADAAMTHLGTFGERYMARFFDVLAPERLTLYGSPDDRVRGALAQLAPAVLTRAAGFHR